MDLRTIYLDGRSWSILCEESSIGKFTWDEILFEEAEGSPLYTTFIETSDDSSDGGRDLKLTWVEGESTIPGGMDGSI